MQGADKVEGYFPQGVWYDIADDSHVDASTSGRNVTLDAPLGHIPVHVAGGSIVPMQVMHISISYKRTCIALESPRDSEICLLLDSLHLVVFVQQSAKDAPILNYFVAFGRRQPCQLAALCQ